MKVGALERSHWAEVEGGQSRIRALTPAGMVVKVALQSFERLAEGHRLFVHEKRDHVALGAAADAGVRACFWIDGERARCVGMEWAVTDEPGAGRGERGVRPNEIGQRDRSLQALCSPEKRSDTAGSSSPSSTTSPSRR